MVLPKRLYLLALANWLAIFGLSFETAAIGNLPQERREALSKFDSYNGHKDAHARRSLKLREEGILSVRAAPATTAAAQPPIEACQK